MLRIGRIVFAAELSSYGIRPDRLGLQLGSKVNVADVGTYHISELADRVGIPATTLRFYERVGLLPRSARAPEMVT